MLVVNMAELDKLTEEARAHPLVVRRREVEQQFLDDLTRLTRRYGLVIKADTRTEYGETYPEHSLETPYEGTEGRYVDGQFGVEFTAVTSGEGLPCSPEERAEFEASKAARREEDEAIGAMNRAASEAHWRMMEDAHLRKMETWLVKAEKRPRTFSCNCGSSFNHEADLKLHVDDTGHAARLFS